MSQTSPTLHELTLIPEHQRDAKWESLFLCLLPHAPLKLIHQSAQTGPDQWPYLYCATGAEATEPAHKIVHWLSEKGIGLAINPDKPAPDFVLSYGMIWNFRETGRFLSENPMDIERSIELGEGQKILAGPPSDAYLPPYVRKTMRQFFTDQQVFQPKILVLSKDMKTFDLCFSAQSLGQPDRSEHDGILQAVSWFLPEHYSLVIISELGFPPFVDL